MADNEEKDIASINLGMIQVPWPKAMLPWLLPLLILSLPVVPFAYMRTQIAQDFVHWLLPILKRHPLWSLIGGVLYFGLVGYTSRWAATRRVPKRLVREDAPKSFVAPHQELFGVKWSPFLIFYGDVRDSIKISDPVCPDCFAPLFYENGDAIKAECPTCKKAYPFERGVLRTKEIARRHFIGLASTKKLNFGNEPGPIGLLRKDAPPPSEATKS